MMYVFISQEPTLTVSHMPCSVSHCADELQLCLVEVHRRGYTYNFCFAAAPTTLTAQRAVSVAGLCQQQLLLLHLLLQHIPDDQATTCKWYHMGARCMF